MTTAHSVRAFIQRPQHVLGRTSVVRLDAETADERTWYAVKVEVENMIRAFRQQFGIDLSGLDRSHSDEDQRINVAVRGKLDMGEMFYHLTPTQREWVCERLKGPRQFLEVIHRLTESPVQKLHREGVFIPRYDGNQVLPP